MQRQQKAQIIQGLTARLSGKHLYLVNTQGLSVQQLNQVRAACHGQQIHCQVVKNTLLKAALNALEGPYDYSPFYAEALKGTSCLLLTEGDPSQPAKLLKHFYKREKIKLPSLKAAFIEGEPYLGVELLDTLAKLKSKEVLLAETIALLQAPLQRVLGGLRNSHHQLTGILKTLAEK